MTTLDRIKNRLIDKILVTKNERLLEAIDTIFNSSNSDETLSIDSYQLEMLMMSEEDIKYGNIISEDELKKEDSKWMD